jgi:hypothetical protein
LQEAVAFQVEFDKARSTFTTELDYYILAAKCEHNPYSLSHADDLLRLCLPRMSSADRKAVLEQGAERIREGEKAFDDLEPVDKQAIIARLRQWRKKWGDYG